MATLKPRQTGASLSRMSDKIYYIGIVVGIIFHAAAFAIWQDYVMEAPKMREHKVVEVIDVPPTVKIKYTPPPVVARPTVPIISDDASVSEESTIETTELDPFAPPAPPPPPKQPEGAFVAYDKAPKLIKMVKPLYPELDRNAGVEGIVILNIQIGTNGHVKNVKLLKGLSEGCNDAAITAVKQWIYEPAYQRDKAVEVWIGQPVTFKLEE